MAKRRKKRVEEEIIETVKAKTESNSILANDQMRIVGIAAAFIILIGAYLAYKYLYQAPKEKNAMEQIFRAEMQFQKDSFALALEAPGGGNEGFLDIIDNYGGTKAANLAKYYAGISYLNLGRYEDAISYLQSHKERGSVTIITKYGAMGDAYSEIGDFDKAISSYEKASNSDNDMLTPYYLYKLGLLAQKENQGDKAKKAFQKLVSDFPKSQEASEASKYIGMLN